MLSLLIPIAVAADPIDTVVRREMTAQKIPGLTVAVIRNGKLTTKRAYGLSDLELNTKTEPDDLFEIGSMTKQFTAFLTMLLVQDGKVGLDDPISKYVDKTPDAWSGIKIRNLLNQTSGLPEYVALPGLGLADEFTKEKWFDTVGKQPMDFAPGTTWAYSNTNYALLGFIIEKAGGKPYTEQLTERVLKPAGMTSTRFQDIYQIWPRRAHGAIRQPDGSLMRVAGMLGSIQSDGTLVSTVGDLAKWDGLLRDRKLLNAEGYKTIWTPAVLNDGRTRPYGMGWFLQAPDGPAYVGHGGNSVGYSAGIARYRDGQKDSLTVVVLGNVYAFSGEELAKRIAEGIDPSLKLPVPKAAASDPDPSRTAHVREMLERLAANKPAEADLTDSMAAPLKGWRAQQFPPYKVLSGIEAADYVREDKLGSDLRLVYRLKTGGRWMTAYLTMTPEGRFAAVQLRRDPA